MDDSLRNLLAGIVLLSAAVFAFVAVDAADVVTPDPSVTPQPQPVAQCNPGWEDKSVRTEHTVVFACFRDGWLVILNADGSFNQGHQDDTPGAVFITDPALIPGWLQ